MDMHKIVCMLGLHKWKYLGIIGGTDGHPEYNLFKCRFCPGEKRKQIKKRDSEKK